MTQREGQDLGHPSLTSEDSIADEFRRACPLCERVLLWEPSAPRAHRSWEVGAGPRGRSSGRVPAVAQ